ncbi:D-cysteine desulfhydrase family protein [Inediibacterium massiliense]|uniref:D-cysteine desulfhydrase family protein n=1 Tax=Inediibacterium massiliense TaxID=1658111 RepID=UPI0006B59E21|nr:D-cysteine desulfhydrase family protein [Inediibacterium massiliense]
MKLPDRIVLANLPTKIEKLERLSKRLKGPQIYIKRDDQTGSEVSGNKVRKLEFAVKEALSEGCDYLITCGGIQSNHARATAAVAARLGISSYLVLRGSKDTPIDGNHFIDELLGAKIKMITPKEYKEHRMEIMEDIKKELDAKGHKAYILPEGASNGIGTFGYFYALEEIMEQEKQMDIHFDAIVVAVGSGGTYGGLFYANEVYKNKAKIYGVNVCDDEEYFKCAIERILHESFTYTNAPIEFKKDDIHILDGYVGEGYALSRPEEIELIKNIAKEEGVILDPVYTGKAMFGLLKEIEKGTFDHCKNILFIHTGGLFGLFPKKELFTF